MVNTLVVIFATVIGMMALFAIFVLGYVLFLVYRRREAVQQALQRRRDRLVTEQQQEQEAWRRQRLRQVVVLLLDKGIVKEGIPIGFQLPGGHREVHARRDLSRLHRHRSDRNRETLTREMDETLDPHIRTVLQTPLHMLLEAGRPPDALDGPDVLQLLLLDREEFTQQSRFVSSADDDSEDSDPLFREGGETAQPTPQGSRTQYSAPDEQEMEDSLTHFLYGVTVRPVTEVMEEDFHGSRLSRQLTSVSDDVENRSPVLPSSLSTSSPVQTNSSSNQRVQRPTFVTIQEQPGGGSNAANPAVQQTSSGNVHFLPPIDDLPEAETKDIKRILRRNRSKKRPVIPAEAIYGPGTTYAKNPDNHFLQAQMLRDMRRRDKISIEMDLPDEINNPTSPITRFLSPLAFPKKRAQSSSQPDGGLNFPTSADAVDPACCSPLAPRDSASSLLPSPSHRSRSRDK